MPAGSASVSGSTAAAPAAGPYAESSHEPMLIGEVGRKARSMLANREGRPRSATSAAVPNDNATSESRRHRRRRFGRLRDAAPSVDEAPATPPATKYAGMNHFQTGALRTGTS